MVRNSVKHELWKDYKSVTKELKLIYQATTEEEALNRFMIEFEKRLSDYM